MLRLIRKAIRKLRASSEPSFKCAATLAATYPHQRATPKPKAMAMGFFTEIVQRHNIATDIAPPMMAANKLDGNGPLINTISAARILAGVPKRRNCLVLFVLTKKVSEANISLVLVNGSLMISEKSSRILLGLAVAAAVPYGLASSIVGSASRIGKSG